MLNDRSSPISLLKTRRSAKPRSMTGPAPDGAELREMIEMAVRVPDHGKLSPWRFVIVDDGRRDALAKALRDALSRENPAAGAAHHEKEEEFAHYGGSLVVLVSAAVRDHKIPVWEQELSCGAVGMNLILAATAMGFVAGWVTGWRAYSPGVTSALCEPGERIAGFIFIGRSAIELEERERPDVDRIVRHWTPGR